MMEQLASYILRVIIAAILVGVSSSMTDPKTGTGGIFKVLGGIFMLIVLIQPLAGFRFDALTAYAEQSFLEGEAAAQRGKEYTRETMAEIITEETQAYILDKAGLYRAQIQVEVILSDDEIPVPAEIRILGSYSQKAKAELETVIATEIGVPKEHQIWIGTP